MFQKKIDRIVKDVAKQITKVVGDEIIANCCNGQTTKSTWEHAGTKTAPKKTPAKKPGKKTPTKKTPAKKTPEKKPTKKTPTKKPIAKKETTKTAMETTTTTN
jgi:hypothetical protein